MKPINFVYVIRSQNMEWRLKKVLDYVMDNDSNIVCWTKSEYAMAFLKKYEMTDDYCVCQTTITVLKTELERKKEFTSHIHLRLVDQVLYD